MPVNLQNQNLLTAIDGTFAGTNMIQLFHFPSKNCYYSRTVAEPSTIPRFNMTTTVESYSISTPSSLVPGKTNFGEGGWQKHTNSN